MYIINLRRMAGSWMVAAVIVGVFLVSHHAFTAYMSQTYPVSVSPTLKALPIFRCQTHEPIVVLTFDVSWGSTVLTEVLSELDAAGVAASFFVSGPWARVHPQLVQDMVSRGHDVASLGWTTVDYRTLTGLQVRHELLEARRVLESFDGIDHSFMRPPLGAYNAEVLTVARSLGYRTVLWDVESWDWRLDDREALVARIVGIVRPGSIIHLHADDSYDVVPRALSLLVSKLDAAGYGVRPLRDMLTSPHGASGGHPH